MSHGSCEAGALKCLCKSLVCSKMQSLQHYPVYYLALGLNQMFCKPGSLSPCYDERSAFGYELLRRHQIRVQRLFLALAVNGGILKQSDILSVSFCISLCYFTPQPFRSSWSYCLKLSSLWVESLGHVSWTHQVFFLLTISKHFVYVISLPLPSKRLGFDRRREKNMTIIDLIHPPEEVKPAQLQFQTRDTEKNQYSHLIWENPLGERVLWMLRARFPVITLWQ